MTATEIDLTGFCGPKSQWQRFACDTPFAAGGHRYFTDMKAVARVPDGGENTPCGERRFPAADRLLYWKRFPLADSRPIPTAVSVPPATKVCPDCEGKKDQECCECDGSGDVEWHGSESGHTYSDTCRNCGGVGTVDEECERCRGTGRVEELVKVEVLGVLIDSRYLRLVAGLPGVRAQADATTQAILFEADGGVQGVVMGMSPG